jgi:hypothetical protein
MATKKTGTTNGSAASGAATENLNGSIGHSSLNSMKGFDHRMPIGGDGSNSAFDYRGEEPLPSSPKYSPKKSATAVVGGGGGGADGNGDGTKNMGIELQFLPPDQRPGLPNDLLASVLVEPEIEDDTEAAEALRANASIKVGKMGKVARSVNAQTVRKLFKTATLRGHGPKRGKPPRVPPGLVAPAAVAGGAAGDYSGQDMHPVHEGEYETSDHDGHYRADENELDIPSDSDDDNSIVDEGNQVKEESLRVHDQEDDGGGDNYQDPDLLAKYQQEDTHRLFETDATDSISKRKSKSENYTQVMTGEDQQDIPTEVVAATMDAGKKCKYLKSCAF